MVLGFGFWVLDFGFWILGFGFSFWIRYSSTSFQLYPIEVVRVNISKYYC
jgi:hypothetical protein